MIDPAERKDRTMQYQEATDALAVSLFGMTTGEAIDAGICVQCKRDIVSDLLFVWDMQSVKEWTISAICPECWEAMFEDLNED
jgi:hypothetical protein